MVRLIIMIAMGALLVASCNALGGDDAATEPAEGLLSEVRPTSTPVPTPTDTPAPEPTLGAGSAEEARNLVWVYLSQCIAFEVVQLQANLVKGDWYVKATIDSPQEYGIWRVNAATGSVETHDTSARQWRSYVDSQCDPDKPVAIRTPAPTPLITEASQAVATVWTYLAKCFSDLPPEDLQATRDPGTGEWVVITKPGAETDYGVWRVQRDASIFPDNYQAGIRQEEVRGETCTLILTTTGDAVATLWTYLIKCFSGLTFDDLKATWDASESEWIVSTKPTALTDHGVWRVRRDAKLFPVNSQARIRDEEVRSESCTLVVPEAKDAVATVWTYLVECSPGLSIEDLAATWDPSNGEWVVITNPAAKADHGVWRVQRDAKIFPVNKEATPRNEKVQTGTC